MLTTIYIYIYIYIFQNEQEPINMALCHICSLTKATAGNIHVCMDETDTS